MRHTPRRHCLNSHAKQNRDEHPRHCTVRLALCNRICVACPDLVCHEFSIDVFFGTRAFACLRNTIATARFGKFRPTPRPRILPVMTCHMLFVWAEPTDPTFVFFFWLTDWSKKQSFANKACLYAICLRGCVLRGCRRGYQSQDRLLQSSKPEIPTLAR